MKLIITEHQYRLLGEALKDEIPSYMHDIIKKRYPDSEKYLNMEVPKHTELIPNIKVEVENENITQRSVEQLVKYFTENITEQFKETKISRLIRGSINFHYIIWQSLNNEMSLQTISNISIMYGKDFRLLQGKDNDFEHPIFSNNKSNLYTFIQSFNRAFPEHAINLNDIQNDKVFNGLRDPIINYRTNIRSIKESKLYLYITDKPDDKLRMSISKFYNSCQNLYTGGNEGTSYNKKLLSNVFDENSKVAYLIFDAPFRDNMGNTQPYTSIARAMIRTDGKKIMFDQVYPIDMEDVMYQIIEEKTGLENQGKNGDIYPYKGIGLPTPYMDTYSLKNTGETSDISSQRIAALAGLLNVNEEQINATSETRFTVGYHPIASARNQEDRVKEYEVLTEDEANERTRDDMRNNFSDLNVNTDLSRLVDVGIISDDAIMRILGVSDEDITDGGYESLGDYLDAYYGTNKFTVADFDDNIKGAGGNIWTWYQENVDINKYIEYFYGSMNDARSSTLGSCNGSEEEYGDFLIYRLN